MKLTERLQQIADLVENQEGTIADIGTDHAHIPIYLAQKFPERKIYGFDVNKGPLKKAEENVAVYGLSGQIALKISDGLKGCLGETISSLVIAGMGGALMTRILKEGVSCLGSKSEMILSPHSEAHLVRRQIHQMGFRIVKEHYVKEAGQIYAILYTRFGQDESYSEMEYEFGKTEITVEKELQKQSQEKVKQEMSTVLACLSALENKSTSTLEKIQDLKMRIDYLEGK